PREVGSHRYYTRRQARLLAGLDTSSTGTMDKRDDFRSPPLHELVDLDCELFRGMIDFHHEMIQTMWQMMQRMDMGRPRDR
ncbi:hypothetical protein KI387_014258, partial [Taxus chinensis]